MFFFSLKRLGATLVAVMAAVGMAVAQQSIEDHPGYVELDVLSELVDVEPHIEILLKGSLLRLAAEASRTEDDELAELLLGLKAIRVEGYRLGVGAGDLAEQLRSAARSITKDLRNRGWDRVAKIREQEAEVYLYVKESGDTIDGLTAMVIDEGGDAVFVNIVGHLDPADVGRIGRKFDIKGLDVE
jgi:hypothetical protein